MRLLVRLVAALLFAAAVGVAMALPEILPDDGEGPGLADNGYAEAIRCDVSLPTAPAGDVKVDFVGNSIAVETAPCVSEILGSRGYEVEMIANGGAHPCDLLGITAQRPAPDVAVFFGFQVAVSECAKRDPSLDYWLSTTRQLVDQYLARGTKVILVPQPQAAGESGEHPATDGYREIAREHPRLVRTVEMGRYLRDDDGTYAWDARCVDGEVGCRKDGTLGIRLHADGGDHFCSLESWRRGRCPDDHAGGERRAASGIVEAVLPILEQEAPVR